jgi:hypothetical protein
VRSELTPQDDFFMLACDGVLDVMANQRLVDFVRVRLRALPRDLDKQRQHQQPYQTPCLSSIIEELFDECLCDDQGIGADNMSAVLVLLRPLALFASEHLQDEGEGDEDDDVSTAAAAAAARTQSGQDLVRLRPSYISFAY